MRNSGLVIDADGHVVDLEDAHRGRLPSEFSKRRIVYPLDGFDRLQNSALAWKIPRDAGQNLIDNDKEGIDVQVLYPTGGLFLTRVRERD
jgi:hypothetical protein